MTKAEAKAAMALHHRQGISLKAAWAQVRHGVRASPGATRKTRSAKPSNGSSPKGGRVGKIYQATSTAVAVLSPATDEALNLPRGGRSVSILGGASMDHLTNVKDKVWSKDYAENLIVEAATIAVDRKFGQAAAITRGSVSAILPEAYLAFVTAENGRRGSLRSAHAEWNLARNGYDPAAGAWYATDPLKAYRLLKHGGQVARKLRTRSAAHGGIIARLLEPVGENVLRPLGMTW